MAVKTRRVYEEPAESDGERVLVDRVWPRGVSREKAAVDRWLREVAPSTELRKWFGHDPARWAGFKVRYFRELDGQDEAVESLVEAARHGTVTLVYAARDTGRNNAVALKEYLETRRGV